MASGEKQPSVPITYPKQKVLKNYSPSHKGGHFILIQVGYGCNSWVLEGLWFDKMCYETRNHLCLAQCCALEDPWLWIPRHHFQKWPANTLQNAGRLIVRVQTLILADMVWNNVAYISTHMVQQNKSISRTLDTSGSGIHTLNDQPINALIQCAQTALMLQGDHWLL